MNIDKLTKKELVEHGKSLGLSLNLSDKKEVLIYKIEYRNKGQFKKDPLWTGIVILLIIICVAYFWLLPIIIQYHLGILVVACLFTSFLIENKLTSDVKFTFGLSIILFFIFLSIGGTSINWKPYYLI